MVLFFFLSELSLDLIKCLLLVFVFGEDVNGGGEDRFPLWSFRFLVSLFLITKFLPVIVHTNRLPNNISNSTRSTLQSTLTAKKVLPQIILKRSRPTFVLIIRSTLPLDELLYRCHFLAR